MKKLILNNVIVAVALTYAMVSQAQQPNWQWVVQGEKNKNNESLAIQVDSAGNRYIKGYFEGKAHFGKHKLKSKGEKDFYLVKYAPNGKVLWAQSVRGAHWDNGADLALDAQGNCYVTGRFYQQATFGQHTLTTQGK